MKNDSISTVLSDVKSEQTRKDDLEKPALKTVTKESQVDEAKNMLYVNLRALCDEPESVRVDATATSHMVIFEITVAPDDRGKVIGKQGVNATAIRRLLHCLGLKHRRQFRMEIVDG